MNVRASVSHTVRSIINALRSIIKSPTLIINKNARISKKAYVSKGIILLIICLGVSWVIWLYIFLVTGNIFFTLFFPEVNYSEFSGKWASLLAAGIVVLVGNQVRKNVKRRMNLQEKIQYSQQLTPEDAVYALSLFDNDDGTIRSNAAYIIAIICQAAPGKIVKHSSEDVTQIVNRLVSLLDDSEQQSQVNAAVALKFFARDYPDAVMEYKDDVLAALECSDSEVLFHTAITIGNLGVTSSEHEEEFTDSISQLLTDEDPDVRIGACIALGFFSHDRSSELLQDMNDDPNPDVVTVASEALGMKQGRGKTIAQNIDGIATNQSASSNGFVGDSPDRDFTDVAGMEALKRRLREQIIEPFHGNDVYEKYGVNPDSGILFHGPPGTGKTYLSKCLAGELGINYIDADVGDIDSKHLGGGVENVKQVFSDARNNQPCLVFIDEIDALAGDRSEGNQHKNTKKTVNQLLQEVSNIDGTDDILVIGATNHPDDVDDAMLRTGRFDSKIQIPKPDAKARIEIFNHHMDAPTAEIDEDEFKHVTRGFVASDIVTIARRAGLQAANREHDTGQETIVTENDVMEAVDKIATEQGSIGEFIERPPDMTFSDVVGAKDLKATLRSRIIEPLTDPEFHEEYGLSIENGILLYGPPGTGKTYISKCLAGELGINFIGAKAGDLVSKWIGEGAMNVQKMFDEARNNQPCLIFIDEIDALATDRSTHRQQKSERQMVNQFLEELSQLHDNEDDVIVIGATNRLNDVDSAMLRTGRFSEKIEVGPPDSEARIALFDAHLSAPSNGLELQEIGEITEGFVASDMENVAERAARKAMSRARNDINPKGVTQADVTEAVSEIHAGRGAEH
jgi:transitional endoplasmic reticulum ATPase